MLVNDTEALYIPNSVITYRLESHLSFEEKKKIGIQITLKKLDIDIDNGDYVLIGPGFQPTITRELSKAQIIAQKIDNEKDFKNIWVNADSAYLRFSILHIFCYLFLYSNLSENISFIILNLN